MKFELNKRNARIAGVLYLAIVIFGIFSEFFVRGSIKVAGDAAATAQNILNNEWMYRLGLVSDIFCQTSHFLLALLLFSMFKPINRNASLFLLSCVLVSVAITFVNLLNHFAPVLILSGDDYLRVFDQTQLESLALFFLNLHGYGYAIAGMFFGLWLFPLGYLVYHSGRFPKLLGIVLMVGSFGYIIDLIKVFLFPEFTFLSYGLYVALLGEFGICFYLLLIGVKDVK